MNVESYLYLPIFNSSLELCIVINFFFLLLKQEGSQTLEISCFVFRLTLKDQQVIKSHNIQFMENHKTPLLSTVKSTKAVQS